MLTNPCDAVRGQSINYKIKITIPYVRHMGGATGGMGGQCPAPHFWDQRGTGGGPMKMIFASTAESLFSTVQVTEFQLP